MAPSHATGAGGTSPPASASSAIGQDTIAARMAPRIGLALVFLPVLLLIAYPLIWLILWFGAGAIAAGGNGFSLAMCIFAVLHALVHWLYERHPACEFRNPLSRSIIWSCAAAGALGIAARFADI